MPKKSKKVKIRQFWDIDPTTKIEPDQSKYDRTQAKKEVQSEIENDLLDDVDEFIE